MESLGKIKQNSLSMANKADSRAVDFSLGGVSIENLLCV